MLASLNPAKWDLYKAAHLLNRAGFGGSPDEIAAFHKPGLEAAVERLLTIQDDSERFPPPDFSKASLLREAVEPAYWLGAMPAASRKIKELQLPGYLQTKMLRTCWLERMRFSPNPLREKMTLFWHGHFATGVQKVGDSYLMWQQNDTLRRNALGNFGDLVKAISRDPAMMIYLDVQNSNKSHPNENFARELMELFTLGIGNYSEEDIRQAARAFTGYRLSPPDRSLFRFAALEHDEEPKQFMRVTSNYNGDGIIDRILAVPACAKFIVRKLLRFFVCDNPESGLVNTLAEAFREGNYELTPLLREIFRSAEFYSDRVMHSLVKSPVQYVIQAAKSLEVELPPEDALQSALQRMGQQLFAPPNVKGWDGGKAWITTNTLLERYNFSQSFLRGGNASSSLDMGKIAPSELRANITSLLSALSFRLFQSRPGGQSHAIFFDFLSRKAGRLDDQAIRDLLHLMMSTPQFQLT